MSRTPMPLRRRLSTSFVTVLTAVAVSATLASCSGDDDAAQPDPTGPVPVLPTAPPVSPVIDDSPFCQAMLDLAAADADDDDTTPGIAEILETYLDVADEAPAEIRPDFDVVIDQLRTIVAGGEVTDPTVAEESAIVVSAYVELHCRGTSQSPLPPPTSPVGDVDADDE